MWQKNSVISTLWFYSPWSPANIVASCNVENPLSPLLGSVLLTLETVDSLTSAVPEEKSKTELSSSMMLFSRDSTGGKRTNFSVLGSFLKGTAGTAWNTFLCCCCTGLEVGKVLKGEIVLGV